MATVNLTKAGSTHYSRTNAKVPYVAEWTVDLTKAAAAKGTALAATDVIEALYLPAGTQVLSAGLQVVEAVTGPSVLTLDLGVTGNDPDRFVDGFDAYAAAKGAFADPASTNVTPTLLAKTADTIDILIATQTGNITGGKLRVYAILVDVNEVPAGGIAAVGS